MTVKISDAVQKLDPSNDGHWTKEGLPAMAVLAVFAGRKVTQEEVKGAVPGFTRETAATYFTAPAQATETTAATEQPAPTSGDQGVVNTQVQGDTENAAAATTAPAATTEQPVTGDNAADDQGDLSAQQPLEDTTEKTDEQELQHAIAGFDEELAEVNTFLDKANAHKAQLNAERDKLVVQLEKLQAKSSDGMSATMGYLDSQNRLREQRAEQIKNFRDSGLTIKMVNDLLPKKSPIDQALSAKRK